VRSGAARLREAGGGTSSDWRRAESGRGRRRQRGVCVCVLASEYISSAPPRHGAPSRQSAAKLGGAGRTSSERRQTARVALAWVTETGGSQRSAGFGESDGFGLSLPGAAAPRFSAKRCSDSHSGCATALSSAEGAGSAPLRACAESVGELAHAALASTNGAMTDRW